MATDGVSYLSEVLAGKRSLEPRNEADSSASRHRAYPKDREGWLKRYEWLDSAYVGDQYSITDIKTFGLFRALTETGDVIAETTRLCRDVQHVVDTDAQALTRGGLVLEANAPAGNRAANILVELGEGVWRRSAWARQSTVLARMLCGLGDVYIEAVAREAQSPYDTVLVIHDARSVIPTYDRLTRTILEKATIVTVEEGGKEYRRTLTKDGVRTTIDGEEVPEETGIHPLGVVPMVHVRCIPWTMPQYSLWAAQGLEPALAYVDSMMAQCLAIGNRYANPKLVVKGAELDEGDNVDGFGRIISGVPLDGDVSILEASLAQVAQLLAAAQAQRVMARETLPEFLFTDSAAGESGEARSWRAASFIAKMEDIRSRFLTGIADATEIAAALMEGRESDPEHALAVDVGPVLPPNIDGEARLVMDVREKGLLLTSDAVRHLQRLGIVPSDADPDKYAQEVEDEKADRAALFFGGGPGGPPGGNPFGVDPSQDDDGDGQDAESPDEDAQE